MEDRNAKELHEEEHFLQNEGEASLYMEEEGEDLTPTDRVLYTVTAPKRAFAGLLNAKLGGVIGISLGVAILLGILTTFIKYSSDDYVPNQKEKQVEWFEKQLEEPSLTSSDREAIEERIEAVQGATEKQYLMWELAGIAIWLLFLTLLVGVLTFIIAKVIEEGRESRVRFVHAFTVASLAGVVSAIGYLIQSGVTRISGNPELQLGLADLVDTDSPVLGVVLGLLSVTSIWWLVVIGIGTAAIARSGIVKATTILFVSVMVLAVLFGLILSQLGAMFSV